MSEEKGNAQSTDKAKSEQGVSNAKAEQNSAEVKKDAATSHKDSVQEKQGSVKAEKDDVEVEKDSAKSKKDGKRFSKSKIVSAVTKKGKRLPITIGACVVVIAIAGSAFWVWHEQPSFCNAFCHTPMDPYVENYSQKSGVAGTDKWGNSVENTSSMLAVAHSVSKDEGGAGANCLSCHVPTIPQQLTEVTEFVSGNMKLFKNKKYNLVLGERKTTDLGKWLNQSGDSFCLNSSCHNMTRQDLVKATSQYGLRNPHMAMHNQQRDCSDCHKAHRASVNACSQCHDDAPIPTGWLTYDQAKEVAESD